MGISNDIENDAAAAMGISNDIENDDMPSITTEEIDHEVGPISRDVPSSSEQQQQQQEAIDDQPGQSARR
jgi:hypothetical protein